MSDADSYPDEATIRKSMRQLRRALPLKERLAASARINQSVLDLEVIQAAKAIGGFLAFDGEADPLPLMTWANEMQRQVFVPMIVGTQKPLMFSPWHPDVPMKTNQFGIGEPDVDRDQWVEPRELDVVITPLVAFDADCHRLGVGGGFYDRSFAFLNSLDPGRRHPKMIGFAFELQRVARIIQNSWDVPLDAVVTERQIYYRNNGKLAD
jgi:5-formyltetrahydrofolate cyclo-ligase